MMGSTGPLSSETSAIFTCGARAIGCTIFTMDAMAGGGSQPACGTGIQRRSIRIRTRMCLLSEWMARRAGWAGALTGRNCRVTIVSGRADGAPR